ncbi:putative ribonuclease H-like domain-containing protein [Tanacetum coccineum]
MRTRNSYYPNNSSVTIPIRRNRLRTPNLVEPELRTIIEVAPMADNRTMEELLQVPTEGYGEAIVIPEIPAENFEIKKPLFGEGEKVIERGTVTMKITTRANSRVENFVGNKQVCPMSALVDRLNNFYLSVSEGPSGVVCSSLRIPISGIYKIGNNIGAIDINTLTIEQYFALTRRDKPGVVIPVLGNDVDFEIKSQFMSELRCNLFAGTDDEVAHEHVRRVLEITDLFHIPGATRDAVMLRVFPITLTRAAKRWKNLLPTGSISTWDLLKNEFIRKCCPPLKIAKNLEEIRNFKQGVDETLYQAWDRYNKLLFKCPQHDLNNHQKGVHPTKERSLKEDDKVGEQVKYIGFLEETINRFMEESIKKQSQMDERIRKLWDDLDMRLRMINVATKNLQGKSERGTAGKIREQEDEAQAFRTLESLKKLKINRSLICAVKRMPEYLMYVKDVFSSKKPIMEMDAVRLNDRCTTVLQNQLPPRENDPGSFNLPCLIENLQPTNIMVEMADRSRKAPKGIIENVLIQIDKFIFSVDFFVIDMGEDHNVSLILGRPFLETAHAHINRHISLGVGEERVSFEITEPMDGPYLNYESVYMIECSRKTHKEELELLLASDTRSSFTEMKEQSCTVNTNEKSEPLIQKLNPFPGISQSSKSSIKMGKKMGKITSPPRYDSNLSFFYPEESLRTPDDSCYFPPHFISSEGIDTLVLVGLYVPNLVLKVLAEKEQNS